MKIPMSPPKDLSLPLGNREKLVRILLVSPLVKGKYAHWDKVRHLTPPTGLSSEEWWLGIHYARSQSLKATPLLDRQGKPFVYGTPDPVLRMLHAIDQTAGGGVLQQNDAVTNPDTRDRYILNSLIAESITSSQLEGASTTTEVAKNMLRSGRKAMDKSEQMIVNNYAAMRFVRAKSNSPLTPDLIFKLHRIVAEDLLDDPNKVGRFRDDNDEIVVEDPVGNRLHTPPEATTLPSRLEAMCAFANERPTDTFLHPVVRAIILHFWIGYDHPFVDGNGRTARALFYWAMQSEGYWLAQYLSISRILKKAPTQYARSFLYTETDGNDLTYFLEYNLEVIERAVDELQSYLAQKTEEVEEVERLLQGHIGINHRQLALLSHSMRHADGRYTIESHRNSHNVSYQTARTDLLALADQGLLRSWKQGNTFQFASLSDLGQRLRGLD